MIHPILRYNRQSGLPRTVTLALFFALLVSLGLRIYRLGDASVWWDEGLAAWAARQPLDAIARWTSADVHPPLYFWLLHFWRLGSGDSEFGLRFLSVAFGVLTVAAAYLLGREVATPLVGLLAAWLVALSRFEVWWSQEMRMYVLAALLATLSLRSAIRFWDRGQLADGILYILFTTAGLYTLYLSVSVLVVANLAWLWVWWRARERWQALVRWGLAQVLVLALYAPWLIYALGRIPTWSTASPIKPGVFLRIYWTVLALGASVNVERYAGLTLPVLALFLLGLGTVFWTARRDGRTGRNAGLLLLGVLLPAGVVYLVSLPRQNLFYSPQLAPRYLLVFAPAFYVLLAWGLARVGQRWHAALGIVGTAFAVGVACYGLWTYYPARVLVDDYKSLVRTLHAYKQPDDAVVLYTDKDWPVFSYHYSGQWHKIPHAQQMTPAAAQDYLSTVWQEHQGLWLVVTPYAGVNDPQGEVPAWLTGRAVDTVEYRFEDKVLRFYARTPARAQATQALAPEARPDRPLQIVWKTGTQLVGYDRLLKEYSSGDTIHLFLYWKGEPGVENQVTNLEVGLQSSKGRRVWQRTQVAVPIRAVKEDAVRQQVDLVIPSDTPGGDYMFAVRPLPDGDVASFGHVSLRQQSRPSLTPADVAITHPLDVDMGDGVRLLGYDLEARKIGPGDTVYLTLYWEARGQVGSRYKVFAHLLGEVYNVQRGSFIWGQQDNEPVNGTRPTSTWRTGEVIVDSYALLLDPGAPDGEYTLEIGLYDPVTLERLPVLDSTGQVLADYVILDHVTVARDDP